MSGEPHMLQPNRRRYGNVRRGGFVALDDYGFTEEEISRLKALRRAALDIHSSSVMRGAGKDGFSLSVRAGQEAVVGRVGHDEERFRSFAIGLRRTYANNDLANFRGVLNAIGRRVDELRPRIDALREMEKAARHGQVTLDGMDHEAIFQAWLYGYLFHDDDPDQRVRWERLSSQPLTRNIARTVVEATAITLAELVLALDDVAADLLEEAHLADDQTPPAVDAAQTQYTDYGLRVRVRTDHSRRVSWIDFVNEGNGEIRNLMLDSFRPIDEGNENVLIDGEIDRKFPVPRLRPGDRVSLMAAPTMGSSLRWDAVLSWEDLSGVRLRDDFQIDLGSA
jgi:hypothetical protein